MNPNPAHRPSRLHRGLAPAAVAAALSLLSATAAQADTYSLTAQVTSFRSWIDTGNASLNGMVNGTVLVDSGVIAGSNFGTSYHWSNAVSFAPGTQTIDFGYDTAKLPSRRLNSFNVAPVAFTVAVPVHTTFDLATLTFSNGQWFKEAEIGVRFVAHDIQTGTDNVYTDTALVTSTSSPVIIVNNLPTFDPVQEADYFVLLGHPEFGSVRVYEAVAQPPSNPGVTGGGTLQAQIGSLDPVGYSSSYGAAFLNKSIIDSPNIPAVPEPDSAALWLAGLGMLGAGTWRARQRIGTQGG